MHYASLVRLARLNVRLRPAVWPGQTVRDYALTVDPPPSATTQEAGPFVVHCERLRIDAALSALSIESRLQVEVTAPPPIPEDHAAPTVASIRQSALTSGDVSATGPASYVYGSPIATITPEIAQWAQPFFAPDQSILVAGRALMTAIHGEFRYDGAATTSDTTPADSFCQRRGVCQDFAHVMIVAARAWGVPAAYVSGYLRTVPPPGKARLIGADAMHAWTNLWCGDALGWIGFDPTNNLIAGSDHIFIAMGRDYGDVAPLDGVFHGGAGQRMQVAVDVEPLA